MNEVPHPGRNLEGLGLLPGVLRPVGPVFPDVCSFLNRFRHGARIAAVRVTGVNAIGDAVRNRKA
jgi:hypothetical protein